MFSIEFASRWTAARAWIASVQMPAAENATIKANIALKLLMSASRIGSG
jgi:hypothetical protein